MLSGISTTDHEFTDNLFLPFFVERALRVHEVGLSVYSSLLYDLLSVTDGSWSAPSNELRWSGRTLSGTQWLQASFSVSVTWGHPCATADYCDGVLRAYSRSHLKNRQKTSSTTGERSQRLQTD